MSERHALFQAAENGDFDKVKDGLDNGFSANTKWDWTMGGKYFGKTLREVAEKCGKIEIIDLIDSYAS